MFTGSNKVGKQIQRDSADTLKRLTLELGGKACNIVMDDVDVDVAVQRAAIACFINSGQFCMSGAKVYVHEKIYDEFVSKMATHVSNIKVGSAWEEGAFNGPVISQVQMEKVLGYIQSGKDQGAKLLAGGNRVDRDGYFIQPTLFADVEEEMKISREEIFGPVMSILKFSTLDEAI